MLPVSYSPNSKRLRRLLLLHGAGSDREQFARFEPQMSEKWASNDLPMMAVATPSVETG